MIALLAGAAGAAGCSSNCGSNCPNLFFSVSATPGDNLNVQTATWTGPACPVDTTPNCRGDATGVNLCVVFTMEGIAPGSCELDLTFTDGRLPFKGTGQFGPETHQGCCQGFPVVGPSIVTIPPLHPPVTFDASPDGDASPDASTD